MTCQEPSQQERKRLLKVNLRRMFSFMWPKYQFLSAISARTAFQEGYGQFLGDPWLVGFALAGVGLCLAIYWQLKQAGVGVLWSYVLPSTLYVSVGFGALVLRRERSRRVHSGAALHDAFHEIRRCFGEVQLERQSTTPDVRAEVSDELCSKLNQRAVDAIAGFFKSFSRDNSANCAIRLAKWQGDGKVVFATAARSSGMLRERESLSVGVPAEQGIVRALREVDNKGVYIIRDIAKAVEDEKWYKTPTDTLPDVKTVMVAAINGFERGHRVNYGFLFVTSRDSTFYQVDTFPLMAFADFLGIVYPMVYTGYVDTSLNGEETT